MAQGSVTVFDEFLPQANYANSALTSTAAGISMDTDTFSWILISDDIDTVLASAATPDRADFTECTAEVVTAQVALPAQLQFQRLVVR